MPDYKYKRQFNVIARKHEEILLIMMKKSRYTKIQNSEPELYQKPFNSFPVRS